MQKPLILTIALLLAACGGQPEPSAAVSASEPASTPISASATTPDQTENTVLFDAREIVLKDQKTVEIFTGKPLTECKKGKYGLSCEYKKGETEIEIVYIKGSADRITLRDKRFKVSDVPQQLGYTYEKSTFMSKEVTRYEKRYGLAELSVFTSGMTVEYVYIKEKTT